MSTHFTPIQASEYCLDVLHKYGWGNLGEECLCPGGGDRGGGGGGGVMLILLPLQARAGDTSRMYYITVVEGQSTETRHDSLSYASQITWPLHARACTNSSTRWQRAVDRPSRGGAEKDVMDYITERNHLYVCFLIQLKYIFIFRTSEQKKQIKMFFIYIFLIYQKDKTAAVIVL